MVVPRSPSAARFSCYTFPVAQTGRTEHQNVTVRLSSDLLREVRHLAVDRGVSLSRFVALILEREVEERQRYGVARERQLTLLGEGLPLETRGRAAWERSELHER